MTVKRVIDFSVFDLRGLPLAKGHQKQRRPTNHLDLPSYKMSARSRKQSMRCALPIFFHFWPRGANPWAKVHQNRRRPGGLRGLPFCKISSPYFNSSPRYPLAKSCRQKNKQTVNDISPHAYRHVGIINGVCSLGKESSLSQTQTKCIK